MHQGLYMIISYLLQYNRYCNLLGIFVILAIAYLFSFNRRAISGKLVIKGILLQLAIALLVLRTNLGIWLLNLLARGVSVIYSCADAGITFLFGNLAQAQGPWGFIFAIKVMPVIIFFGALTAWFFHMGIIQRVVNGISRIIRPILGTSGAETLCAIANSFLGQTEAPLVIRYYLLGLTKSEMLVVMVSGMATISGAILMVYASMGVPAIHLLTASVMAIPASIIIAKILLPQMVPSQTQSGASVRCDPGTKNSFDAIARGTSDGLTLMLNIAAMLISFLALLALINFFLELATTPVNILLRTFALPVFQSPITIQLIFGYLFAPLGYLFGFTGAEALAAAQLLGTKVALNEMIAYSDMVKMQLSPRAVNLLTYALCGFSNFSCIGIQLGGIGALVPERREWLSQLGLYAVLGGMLSNLLTAMIVGLLI
jgi:CNT family concentrative nucleoside transporter